MEKIDKMILNVIASFQMEHIYVPIDVIRCSKEMLNFRLKNNDKKNKVLVKRNEYYDKRGIKY